MRRRTFLGLAGSAAIAAAADSELDFQQLLPKRVSPSAVFKMKDYVVWGASVVKADDGLYHMLFSRWPLSLGHNSWATHSEIAHATAKKPEGPFHFAGPALPARGVKSWDGHGTHNPCIIRHRDKYYLYYVGQHGPATWKPDAVADEKSWWIHRNNQRVGVAVADHPGGPWRRLDRPIIDAIPEFGHGITSTPCVMERPTGGFLMVYKTLAPGSGNVGGGVYHYPATAESPTGPFIRYSKPMVDKSRILGGHFNFHIDDHFEWYQDGRYYAIVKDHDAPYLTKHGRCLYLIESANGLDWKQSKHALVTPFHLVWENGARQDFTRLEMPKLYMEDGEPRVLYLAALPKDDPAGHSFNIAIPLKRN